VLHWRPHEATAGDVRIDNGIAQGGEVSPHYDPMVAKLIVHGRDRDDAIRRLRAALADAPLIGLRHNARFLSDLVNHPAFRQARMTTTLIDQWQAEGDAVLQRPVPSAEVWCLAAAVMALRDGTGWRADSVAGYGLTLACDDSAPHAAGRCGPVGSGACAARRAYPRVAHPLAGRWLSAI